MEIYSYVLYRNSYVPAGANYWLNPVGQLFSRPLLCIEAVLDSSPVNPHLSIAQGSVATEIARRLHLLIFAEAMIKACIMGHYFE